MDALVLSFLGQSLVERITSLVAVAIFVPKGGVLFLSVIPSKEMRSLTCHSLAIEAQITFGHGRWNMILRLNYVSKGLL